MDISSLSISPVLLAAMISFLGVVIFAPVVNRALIQRYETKHKLTVKTYSFDLEPSNFLADKFKDFFSSELDEDEKINRIVFRNLRGYIKLELHNKGSKTIENITISLMSDSITDFSAQIDNQKSTCTFNIDKPLKVGNLQPNLSRKIHLYCNMSVINYTGKSIASNFHVSADQIDRMKYLNNSPNYAEVSDLIRKLKSVTYVFLVFLVFYAIYIISIVIDLLNKYWTHK